MTDVSYERIASYRSARFAYSCVTRDDVSPWDRPYLLRPDRRYLTELKRLIEKASTTGLDEESDETELMDLLLTMFYSDPQLTCYKDIKDAWGSGFIPTSVDGKAPLLECARINELGKSVELFLDRPNEGEIERMMLIDECLLTLYNDSEGEHAPLDNDDKIAAFCVSANHPTWKRRALAMHRWYRFKAIYHTRIAFECVIGYPEYSQGYEDHYDKLDKVMRAYDRAVQIVLRRSIRDKRSHITWPSFT